MAIKDHGRQYDLIVFGASGYTGQLTAEHITAHLPTNLKWAVAGRSPSKLQGVVKTCNKVNPDRKDPDIETADVNDEASLAALAKKTYVFISTVGPYCIYGEKVVKVCAEAGTHYLDCTGEFPWVQKMIKKYEQTAVKSGAILIPQFGIESAPADLCTYALAQHVRNEIGAPTKDVTVSIADLRSAPSGGTLETVLSIFDYFTLKEVQDAGRPYALSPVAHDSRPRRQPHSILQTIFGSRSVSDLGTVTTSPAGITDAAQVERSWGLFQSTPSRKAEAYGPNFTFAEFMGARNWLSGVGLHWALVLGSFFLAFVPLMRSLARRFVYQPGQGPERDGMSREYIEYRGTATPDVPADDAKSKRKAYVKAHFGGGSMYYLTGLFLAEGALSLLEDDPDLPGGFFTPACLGFGLIDRAHKAGFKLSCKTLEG